MTKQILKQTIEHTGEVYGASPIECGNYANLSTEAARLEAKRYLAVLEAQTNMEFTYPE
jgi:S-ribosylhomocysteine lyase